MSGSDRLPGREDRRELIREAARKIAARKSSTPVRLSIGITTTKKAPTLKPTGFELRQRALQGAIAHLKRHCILVDPVDRMAPIKRYRVSGKRESRLAEEVIELAVSKGFEVPRA